ncbi:hypothetical protein, partial [Victivallis vadensis]|uniref:hypothetical protein n=1 Tax=Victivallis vadensis TaxID=172901 RepID=UPI0026DD368D
AAAGGHARNLQMLTGKQTGTLMEADKNLSASIGWVRSGNNAIAISQTSILEYEPYRTLPVVKAK